MRRPDGYATIVGDVRPGDVTLIDLHTGERHVETEVDTFACGHCQRVTHVRPYQRPEDIGGGCRICQRNICGPCVDKGICVPWEEMVAKMEARRSYGF